MRETLILAFDGSVTHSFVNAQKAASSVFGGPPGQDLIGKWFGRVRLHHMSSLSSSDLPILGPPRYIFELPLFYGMRYDACNLTYQFDCNGIRIVDMTPKRPTEDWPYKDYPPILPYVPVAVARRKKQSWRQFAAEFPNMPESQPSDLVVVVPPPMTLGVSLWGREGDAEGVAIVFECDLNAKRVKVYNVCS